MHNTPNFIEKSKTLSRPFNENGDPTLVTSILATLLSGKPLSKEAMLTKVGEQHTGKSRGYLSNHFNELSKSGILKHTKRYKQWTQGINFHLYMGFVFMELLKQEPQAVASLQYRLLPKHDAQSVDFITSPDEDIFNQPNPFLEDKKSLTLVGS